MCFSYEASVFFAVLAGVVGTMLHLRGHSWRRVQLFYYFMLMEALQAGTLMVNRNVSPAMGASLVWPNGPHRARVTTLPNRKLFVTVWRASYEHRRASNASHYAIICNESSFWTVHTVSSSCRIISP